MRIAARVRRPESDQSSSVDVRSFRGVKLLWTSLPLGLSTQQQSQRPRRRTCRRVIARREEDDSTTSATRPWPHARPHQLRHLAHALTTDGIWPCKAN